MKRRPKRAHRKNLTAHKRAIASPQTESALNELRKVWDRIDRIERGERLRQLIERGCSRRGLGEALRQSASTIRRHMTLAALPEQEREEVRAGSSAKRILAKKSRADRLRKRQARVETDSRTGEFSDRIADTILAFCRRVKGTPELPIMEKELVFFLSEARNAMWQLERRGAQPIKLTKRLTLKQCFARTRPPYEDGDLWMGYQAKWLANLLLAEAAEKPIRERAIEKAGERAKELRIRMTPMQLYAQRIARLAHIAAPLPRRRF